MVCHGTETHPLGKKCKLCARTHKEFEQMINLRQTLLDMIDSMRKKGYEADTMLDAVENNLRFNKFKK